jgi:hypothetical protein
MNIPSINFNIPVFPVLLLLFLGGCDEPNPVNSYAYTPYEGIRAHVLLNNIEVQQDDQYMVLRFDLEIDNTKQTNMRMNPRNFQLRLNGELSVFTGTDGLGSAPERPIDLPMGTSKYAFFSLFPKSAGKGEIREFDVVDFGIRAQIRE